MVHRHSPLFSATRVLKAEDSDRYALDAVGTTPADADRGDDAEAGRLLVVLGVDVRCEPEKRDCSRFDIARGELYLEGRPLVVSSRHDRVDIVAIGVAPGVALPPVQLCVDPQIEEASASKWRPVARGSALSSALPMELEGLHTHFSNFCIARNRNVVSGHR